MDYLHSMQGDELQAVLQDDAERRLAEEIFAELADMLTETGDGALARQVSDAGEEWLLQMSARFDEI